MSGKSHAKLGGNQEKSVDLAAQFLRSRYPVKTADRVAHDIGIPANTVAKWLAGVSYPNGRATIALIRAYGAEFLATVIPEGAEWLSEVMLDHKRDQLAKDMAALQSRMEALR
jgi:DNA-binding transcriptional regulator YiaG